MREERFQIYGGSVPGREHLHRGGVLVGRSNQDAFGWTSLPGSLVSVVCDGCGSGAHSEVGASLGTRLLLAAFARELRQVDGLVTEAEALLERVERRTLRDLRALLRRLGEPWEAIVHDYLLFTVVGFVLDGGTVTVFALGDGLVALDDEVLALGPFPDNAPPYLGSALLADRRDDATLHLTVVRHLPIDDLTSVAIGTDGALDLAAAADRRLPGRAELLGPLTQFWRDPRYARNPDALRRRLCLANSLRSPKEPGLLPDDTTLVVCRRRDGIEGGRE
jgi:hypothetical protein